MNRMLLKCFSAGLCVMLAACASGSEWSEDYVDIGGEQTGGGYGGGDNTGEAGLPPRYALSEGERQSCMAQGGTVQMGGIAQAEYCAIPYADAGEQCMDSSECEGRCVTYDLDNIGPGKQVAGQCQAQSPQFGCYAEVMDGRAEAALCVD